MYNYYESTEKNIKAFLEEEFSYRYSDVESIDELQENLNDDLWANDSVTGNGSGSYTFDRNKAKENVVGNMELCVEALKEFCVEPETIAEKFLDEDWEYFDVTIRCYILGGCISSVMEEIEDDFNNWLEEKEAEENEEE